MLLPWRGVMVGWEHGPAFATSIHEDEAARLEALAAGQHVLEVGSAYGYSACIMARAGALSVMAVDPHQALPSADIMAANIAALRLGGTVDMVADYSGNVLPGLAEAGRK